MVSTHPVRVRLPSINSSWHSAVNPHCSPGQSQDPFPAYLVLFISFNEGGKFCWVIIKLQDTGTQRSTDKTKERPQPKITILNKWGGNISLRLSWRPFKLEMLGICSKREPVDWAKWSWKKSPWARLLLKVKVTSVVYKSDFKKAESPMAVWGQCCAERHFFF
jgi:hypothetical protein